MKAKIVIRIFFLIPILLLDISCSDPIKPITNDLSFEAKENIAEAAKKFNATLTRTSFVNLRNEALKNIPNSLFIKDLLSNFGSQERDVFDAVSSNTFFDKIFDKVSVESNARGLNSTEVPLSKTVQEYMLKLNEIIPNAIKSSTTTGDLELDQELVTTMLIEKFNSIEGTVKSDNRLNRIDADILLMTLEFHKSTIPSIITSLALAEKNSSSGRVNWNWNKFWTVVAVIVVTAVAVALIGSAIAATWASVQGFSSAAITAASYAGLYWGAGVGAVGGLIAGASGYCPDNWFEGGVPLVDWTTDCNDYI